MEACREIEKPKKEIVCNVCGEAICENHEVTTCGKCATPHHTECWNYAGRCAVYGCGFKNNPIFQLPQTKIRLLYKIAVGAGLMIFAVLYFTLFINVWKSLITEYPYPPWVDKHSIISNNRRVR